MAIQLGDKLKIAGGYLDETISVETLEGLLLREPEFYGQSIHMTDAFYGNGDTPYPIDFWLVPDSISEYKWEIKTIPALASLEDFENFKDFINQFNSQTNYYPLANGTKILVNGQEIEFYINENGETKWLYTQEIFNEIISDAVKLGIDRVTSGASEAFDTLKEIEDWIKASGSTSGPGADGKDGITPLFKIENELWFISYNEGETWEELGKATGDKGESGENGVDGKSAYQIWLDAGNDGSEVDFLDSLKGEQGIQGEKGDKGALDEEQIALLKDEIKSYTDSAITATEEKIMWLPVEGINEKHVVRHWRGTRDKYEFLVKNNAVSDWTRYVVIDTINDEDVITEYYGTNQVTELTGQLLPANSIIANISEVTPKPYDRYLVGSNGNGYSVYEYVIDSEGQHRWLIKPFDDRFGIRIKDRGLKNYLYVDGELITYDEVDCGTF